MNIPKEDFLLRTEVVSFLSSQDLDETLLIFRDDIDLSTLAAGSRLKLTLVDHNVLSREDADQLDPCIVQIIDHHDNGRVEEEGREIDIQLEPVGSCTTLVLADILKKSEELLDERIAALAIGLYLCLKIKSSWILHKEGNSGSLVVTVFFLKYWGGGCWGKGWVYLSLF